jgi:membrane-associated phospholipid phosphatase
VDYRLYHAINRFVADHAWLGRAGSAFEKWAVPVYAVAAIALWLLARPGGNPKWKLASASSLGAAALALLVNRVIAGVWDRERPFAAHPSAHVWGGRSHDPSFPSDHATGAFALAFGIWLYDRTAGTVLLVLAAIMGFARVYVGTHYPGDVIAGALIGVGVATVLHLLPTRRALESGARYAGVAWDASWGRAFIKGV